MKYLLDTNVCIHFLNQSDGTIVRQITAHGRRNIGICPIIIEELFFGAYRSARIAENVPKVRLFASIFEVWPFDVHAAHESGRIRSYLAKLGQTIGPFDNLIAGVALAGGATLVTHNLNEFQRVPGLLVEDWQGQRN